MNVIEYILEFNQNFVKNKKYEPFVTSKYPDRKLAIITCMDTRLTELLPAALGLKNGDAKIIKNAGGVVLHPFGSAVRSLLIAIYELDVDEIMIIGHTDCGVQHMDCDSLLQKMLSRGVSVKDVEMMEFYGVNFNQWLSGFDDIDDSVKHSISLLEKHPLIPDDIQIYGYVMDSLTGELRAVE